MSRSKTTPGASPILAMHARYEAAWTEFNSIEAAKANLNTKNEAERDLAYRYDEAMKANTGETDALRVAMLYQVPSTWQEALILQFHVQSAADPALLATQGEKDALEVGHDTLFDFMSGEVDLEGANEVLRNTAEIVCDRRRFRTGSVGA